MSEVGLVRRWRTVGGTGVEVIDQTDFLAEVGLAVTQTPTVC